MKIPCKGGRFDGDIVEFPNSPAYPPLTLRRLLPPPPIFSVMETNMPTIIPPLKAAVYNLHCDEDGIYEYRYGGVWDT